MGVVEVVVTTVVVEGLREQTKQTRRRRDVSKKQRRADAGGVIVDARGNCVAQTKCSGKKMLGRGSLAHVGSQARRGETKILSLAVDGSNRLHRSAPDSARGSPPHRARSLVTVA